MCVSGGQLALLWGGGRVINTFCGRAVASLVRGFLPALRAVLLVVCGLIGWSGQAQAQTSALQCDTGLYLSQTQEQNTAPTQLIRFDTSTNPITFNEVGAAENVVYNATAFNPQDSFLYAIERGTNVLLRVSNDGSVEELGAVGGLPEGEGTVGFPAGYISGEIDPDGNYYVSPSSINDHLYRIDLGARTATLIETSLSIGVSDLAWHNGRLYSVGTEELPSTNPDRDQLYEIDPVTGHVNRIGEGTPDKFFASHFGALFGASNGVFGVNNEGGLYQFDTQTGVATLISDAPGSDTNDGAKCVTTALEFRADLEISKDDGNETYTAGKEVKYTIVVSNLGPFGSSGAIVNDRLPDGITTASWTCVSATGGGVCGAASGEGAIENVPVSLPVAGEVTSSVTFTLTLLVPEDYTGELVNEATVASDSPDEDLSNNIATDRNVTTTVQVSKSANPTSGTAVSKGETLAYTLSVDVANAATNEAVELIDTLDDDLTLNSSSLPDGCSAEGQEITCTLDAGAVIGEHTFTYTATVNEDATTEVENSVTTDDGVCAPEACSTRHPVDPTILVNKSAIPASGSPVSVGDTLAYTLRVDVANAVTGEDVVLTDTLGAGLTLGILSPDCSAVGQVITCTLDAGAAIGPHTFGYTATVDDDATTTVGNSVSVTTDNAICGTCSTSHPVNPTILVSKTATPDSGTSVSVGQSLTYTLSVDVANAATNKDVELTDTLGTGLTLDTLPAGCSADGQEITCTLAAGAAIDEYTFTYTATVNEDATTEVKNSVETTVGVCETEACSTSHPVNPTILVSKSATPASGTSVSVGDLLTYTLSVDVANAATNEAVELTDTLGTGLTLDTLPDGCSANGQADEQKITCTLAAGAEIRTHTFEYTATVNEDATTEVENSVTTDDGDCGTCSTSHPVNPTILVSKSATPDSGLAVSKGETLTYTLRVDVANAATNEAVVLTDTLGAGLTRGTLPSDCGVSGQVITCTLAAGAPIGAHTFEYTASVNDNATTEVKNSVETNVGDCKPGASCSTRHPVDPTILINKTASPASGTAVSVGDALTYTLTVGVANAVTDEDVVLTDTLGTGLTLGTLPDGCSADGQEITCTLAAGAAIDEYTFTYTATVGEDATTEVENSVTTDDGVCGTSCSTSHPVNPTILVSKSATPDSGTSVSVGQSLTYTLSVDVANAATNKDVELTDTLGTGLTLDTLPAGCSADGQEITCTLAAGAAIDEYTFTYTATVNDEATTTVRNSVTTDDGVCESGTCTTEHPVNPTIQVRKTAIPASGSPVSVGNTLTYFLRVDVANAATKEPVVLTDTLGEGLSLIPDSLPDRCSADGQEITCTLAAGAGVGVDTHGFAYNATVNEDATTVVGNSVETSVGVCEPEACSTSHPVDPTIQVRKTANPASGSTVSVGDTLTYTLSVDVANAVTDEEVVLTDTLGAGLNLGPLPADCSADGQVITCTLAVGADAGSYSFEYTATVNEDATAEVGNSVSTNVGVCAPETCITSHPLDSTILVGKTAIPASGTPVSVGDTLTYTLSVDVANAVTDEDVVLTDTLGAGLTLGTLPTGCLVDGQVITCTLAAGADIGRHTFEYTASVSEDATTDVENRVTTDDGVCEPGTCTTSNPVLPRVQVSKTADPEDGTEVAVGDILTYTLSATVSNGATIEALTLSDTLGDGQTLLANSVTLPSGGSCSAVDSGLECALAVGTPPGVYLFTYQTRVDPDAGDAISNNVVASGGGGGDGPDCTVCSTGHPVANQMQLRLTKSAGVRSARIGDLVRYVLTVENVGIAPVTDAVVVDTPPPGFNYVENSMSVDDGDDAFELSPGRYPLRIGGFDLAVGEQGTIAYVLRIGAGARHGSQINSVVAQSAADEPISNVATAQVNVETGPLLDDSLIFGTVFDDRDADGWRDSAALTGIRVQGGFEPRAYIPPMAGASAPLLQGITLGDIAARQSEGDPIEAHRLVIRQHLSEPAFTDDFVLISDQGVTVRMDAAGNTRVEKSGDAARGLNAAEPIVERRLFQEKDGLVVDYVISNAGIDERGLPGVRLASAEGVLIETDQYGRYHLVDVQGGERGYSNFLLKVDPSTLPPDTPFTTENPRMRRITPGVPVRFDFGVQLPVERMPGGTEEVELALGEVIFAPGSAEVRAEYRPAIARMAEQVDAYGGGEVVITADGTRQALAFERAVAVRDLLIAQVAPEHAQALTVSVRTEVNELVSGTTAGGLLLGTVLFDTDRSEIRPEFEAVIERVAAHLEEMGSGVVALVGHTDVRASYEYNVALGLRRAQAVYEALAARLSPEVRARIRVESSNDPKAPVASANK